MTDFDTCFYKTGLLNRVWTHGPQIGSKGLEFFKIVTDRTPCKADKQVLREMQTATEDVAAILSYLVGFKGTYNESEEVPKMRLDSMADELTKKEILTPEPMYDIRAPFEEMAQ